MTTAKDILNRLPLPRSTPGEIGKDIAHEIATHNAKEIYQDGIQRPLTGIGNATGIVSEFFGNTILAPLERISIASRAKTERFRQELNERLLKIPEENRVQPRLSVVGPAVENLKFTLDEKELRSMFLNLLSSSVDRKSAELVHQSFSSMIAQMSPMDAKVLNAIKPGALIACSRVSLDNGKDGNDVMRFIDALLEYLAPELVHLGDIFEISSSLSNLQRLGLIDISDTARWVSNYDYEKKCNSVAQVIQAKKAIKAETGIEPRLKIFKGVLTVNDLGKRFCKVCLNK